MSTVPNEGASSPPGTGASPRPETEASPGPDPGAAQTSRDRSAPQRRPESGRVEPSSLPARVRRLVVGRPRDLADRSLLHQLSLVPFLAWVGLGADGLSSSAYGPEEAFRTLGEHTHLAILLAAATAATVSIISLAYSRIIEEFPHGGGGYVVATKLLGERAGVVSGSALLVDYVLTITMSIAAAGDALFSFLPPAMHGGKLPAEALTILALTALNIRGVRESVKVLTPIFLLFLATHALLLAVGVLAKVPEIPRLAVDVGGDLSRGIGSLGLFGMLVLFLHAYSLGGGTYTGIEAVSNGLPIMREPRVATAKRTMLYMAVSLSVVAAGLLVAYLLWSVRPEPGKTLNAVLAQRVFGTGAAGATLVVLTLLAEGAILVVAAQAGFIDGPRVLANMAVDSWVPQRFAALSERLTTQNGIVLMGAASVAGLLYTGGSVHAIVVMYSINVFLTFSLSLFAMARAWLRDRVGRPERRRRLALFGSGFVLCATILAVTVVEKFGEGGWITLVVTGSLIAACFLVRAHYRGMQSKLRALYVELEKLPRRDGETAGPVDPSKPTAAVLVSAYGGLGIHTVLNVFRQFPGHYKNIVFLSVGVVDSGNFKGEGAIEGLKARTAENLAKYLGLAAELGVPACARSTVGTDVVAEAEGLCAEVFRELPNTTVFLGKLVLPGGGWSQTLLHNQTALALQKRLEADGHAIVIVPVRL